MLPSNTPFQMPFLPRKGKRKKEEDKKRKRRD
jgi:hypothetical protein